MTVPATLFDYSAVDADVALDLRMRAERIRMRLKRSAEDIIAIGQELQEAKARLPHGHFGAWLAAEFEMAERTARNFMQVAERFGSETAKIADLSVSAIYALAAPSTSDAIVERVASGEIAPTPAAIREAKEAEKAAKGQAALAQSRLHMAEAERERIKTEAQAQIDVTTRQLTQLQRELEALHNAPKPAPEVQIKEVVREVTPARVQEQVRALEQRIRELSQQKDAIQKRAAELEKLAEADTQRRYAGENQRRITLKWYATVSELMSSVTKALQKAGLQMPTALDTAAFEADDWQRVQEVRTFLARTSSELERFVSELDGLYAGVSVVDATQERGVALRVVEG